KKHPRNIPDPQKARIYHKSEKAYHTTNMAQGFGSKVFVFHATKPMTRFFHGEIHLTPAQWEKRLPGDISDFIGHIRKYKIEIEGWFSPGATAWGITIEAAAKRHDLIIMGASQRNLLSAVLKGNPVEDVLRTTPCDLIILSPRHED
ncbi:MAG: universal stress protein, partial [Deltaproteobacteria bacterium]|nr:universal stress protein [Deltaproteobacteria bacterium]